jgi:glycosyltransferase involved in cell wall biosynthesis
MYELRNFEILCQDDASNSSLNALNEHVNELSNCSFVSLKENLAHRANRNSLPHKAKFDYLLFIDGDSIIIHDKFIKKYIDTLILMLFMEGCILKNVLLTIKNYVGNTGNLLRTNLHKPKEKTVSIATFQQYYNQKKCFKIKFDTTARNTVTMIRNWRSR